MLTLIHFRPLNGTLNLRSEYESLDIHLEEIYKDLFSCDYSFH